MCSPAMPHLPPGCKQERQAPCQGGTTSPDGPRAPPCGSRAPACSSRAQVMWPTSSATRLTSNALWLGSIDTRLGSAARRLASTVTRSTSTAMWLAGRRHATHEHCPPAGERGQASRLSSGVGAGGHLGEGLDAALFLEAGVEVDLQLELVQLALELPVACEALLGEIAPLDRLQYRAAGLARVPAVAEGAASRQLLDVGEGRLEPLPFPELQLAHAGGV